MSGIEMSGSDNMSGEMSLHGEPLTRPVHHVSTFLTSHATQTREGVISD